MRPGREVPLNISTVISQLIVNELYGDLPDYQVVAQS